MHNKKKQLMQFLIVVTAWLLPSAFAQAGDLTVQVKDASGAAVENAVVYAESSNKSGVSVAPAPAQIAQMGRKFIPLVTVVQTGSSISFPNHDTVRHHVYSFSPAKIFELKLYSGVPSNPVVFDKPGTVVLGCNIHDQMLAFVEVVNTPYFAKTDASGKAKLADLPSGDYQLKTWHYALVKENLIVEQPVSIKGNEQAEVKLELKPFPVPAQ